MASGDPSRGETTRLEGEFAGVAEAFGARISLPMEGRSLFFVVGRDGPPDAAIRGLGGVVVTRLPDPRRVLAIAELAALSALRQHPALQIAGPVSIDAERFGRFAQLVGLDDSPEAA